MGEARLHAAVTCHLYDGNGWFLQTLSAFGTGRFDSDTCQCGGTSIVGATPTATKELYIVDLVNHCFQMSMWGFAEVQQYGGVLRHEIRTLLTCFIAGNVGIIP